MFDFYLSLINTEAVLNEDLDQEHNRWHTVSQESRITYFISLSHSLFLSLFIYLSHSLFPSFFIYLSLYMSFSPFSFSRSFSYPLSLSFSRSHSFSFPLDVGLSWGIVQAQHHYTKVASTFLTGCLEAKTGTRWMPCCLCAAGLNRQCLAFSLSV